LRILLYIRIHLLDDLGLSLGRRCLLAAMVMQPHQDPRTTSSRCKISKCTRGAPESFSQAPSLRVPNQSLGALRRARQESYQQARSRSAHRAFGCASLEPVSSKSRSVCSDVGVADEVPWFESRDRRIHAQFSHRERIPAKLTCLIGEVRLSATGSVDDLPTAFIDSCARCTVECFPRVLCHHRV
jgi:hypothetical protein